MEQSNISNSEKTIQNIVQNKKIFLHIIQPEYLPVGTVYESIKNLDQLENSYYEQIIINDLLDYIGYNEASAILDSIINKLQENLGEIIIQSADLRQLSSSIMFGDIDIQTAKIVIYDNKKTIYTMSEIESEFKNRNLKIIEKKYINIFEYYVRASK
jgi:hypothetical protein